MKNLVLKPSNKAVNHVYYPSSLQRNSERPNTANYCSCWQIQPQNRTASCQLHALTTVTNQGCYHDWEHRRQQRLSPLYPRSANSLRSPWQLPQASITQTTEKEMQPNISFCWSFDNLETRSYCAFIAMDKAGLEVMVVSFNGAKMWKGHWFSLEKAWWLEAQACPCHNWEVQSWGGGFNLSHTPTKHQSWGYGQGDTQVY